MLIAIPIFDRITALDAVGPYEVLSRIPNATVQLVATTPGLKRASGGNLGLNADRSLADVPHCDVLVVPGGPGHAQAAQEPALLNWLREVDQTSTWSTSVCTGALVLAAAGVLRGRRARTHWLSTDRLGELGAVWDPSRVVTDGKYMTSAGVSAGIDMALTLTARLAGPATAQAIQLSIEYDPEPPFRSGSVSQASAQTIERVRQAARTQAQSAT